MRSSVEIKRIADGIYQEVVEGISKFNEVRKSEVLAIADKTIEEGLEVIADILKGVETMFKAANVDLITLPAFLSKFSTVDSEHVTSIHLRVTSKLRAEIKYSKDADIKVDENFILNVAEVYEEALYAMYYANMANDNVKELNARIADLLIANDIPYMFEFAVNLGTEAPVLSISDTNIVFNANIQNAHSISDLPIFQSGDSYSDLIRNEAETNLIEALKGITTPVQLIKSNVKLIRTITDLATKKRASKLIRMSYHRQAKFLDKVNAGIGYYNETVNIDGVETEVFALVEKVVDGTMSVILRPFDVKTMMNVDYDVLGALAS